MTDIATKHPERTLLSSLTGTVMVPGDVVVDFAHMPAGSVLRVGRGLQQDGQKLVAVQAGRLCCVLGKSKLWIEAPQKRADSSLAPFLSTIIAPLDAAAVDNNLVSISATGYKRCQHAQFSHLLDRQLHLKLQSDSTAESG
eukprot:TRINITY_DN13222_c0_g1_i2.p1 TRINITY_DN13222_c0_g1~~TRINITY_DN13222_c0_g1_i2.p1  ORF type:complete len:165 (-),score=37.57 TRINITY_DN13222_c0_g1_i2:206-628(-)